MHNNKNIPEYSVSEFNKSLKDVVESNFNYLKIKGEISDLKNSTKGHIYITLKDEESILSGVIWEGKKRYLEFQPELGVEVIVTGKITTWSKFKTTYQIDIDKIDIAGEGALLKLIEDRKKKLEKKGIFKEKYKKKIPYVPSKLGIITSPSGSVIHDILNRLQDRFPLEIDLWPAAVQGVEAVPTIINALKGFNDESYDNKPDVIIIARGGGSTEDLMAFNDEELVLEIFKSKIPIISAVGHETDTTLTDFVSDLRASTPTAAAELAVPVRKDLENIISNLSRRIRHLVKNNYYNKVKTLENFSKLLRAPNSILEFHEQKFQSILNNFKKEINFIFIKKNIELKNIIKNIKSPENFFEIKTKNLINLCKLIEKNISINYVQKRKKFDNLIRVINSNSIRNNLKKGYVILSKSRKILKKSKQITENDSISIKFYDKTIGVKIKKIN